MPIRPPNTVFRDQVYAIVRMIPQGRVMTYGQVALLCGLPRAAQAVGWTLHTAPSDVPYQRVVNRHGGLAGGYTDGGITLHRAELQAEGVEVRDDFTVELVRYQWWPAGEQLDQMQLAPEVRALVAARLDALPERVQLRRRRLR